MAQPFVDYMKIPAFAPRYVPTCTCCRFATRRGAGGCAGHEAQVQALTRQRHWRAKSIGLIDMPRLLREFARGATMRGDQFLLDFCSVFKPKSPGRPWFCCERLNLFSPITADYTWSVTLRGKHEFTAFCFNPGIKAVDQNHSTGGRRIGG